MNANNKTKSDNTIVQQQASQPEKRNGDIEANRDNKADGEKLILPNEKKPNLLDYQDGSISKVDGEDEPLRSALAVEELILNDHYIPSSILVGFDSDSIFLIKEITGINSFFERDQKIQQLPDINSFSNFNQSPIFTNNNLVFSISENNSEITTITASDPDNDTLIFSIVGGDDANLFTINPTGGNLSFRLPPDFESPIDFDRDNAYQVDIAVTDANSKQASQSITINIENINEAPIANDDSMITNEDAPVIIQPLLNDNDVDSIALQIISVQLLPSSSGIITLLNESTLQFDPNNQYDQLSSQSEPEIVSFNYTISDGELTDVGTVTISITGLDSKANPDFITISEDDAVAVDVLTNDTGQSNQWTITNVGNPVSSPDNPIPPTFIGTAAATNNNTAIIYNTNSEFDALQAGQSAIVIIPFSMQDIGGLTDSTTLTVTILGANDSPTDITFTNLIVNENEKGAAVGDLTVIDPDNNDTHTFNIDDQRFEVVNSTLKLKPGEMVTFEDEPLIDLQITATDSGNQSYTEMVQITVNDTPEIIIDKVFNPIFLKETPILDLTNNTNSVRSIQVADIDGDGDMDVFVNRYDGSGVNDGIFWYENDGNGVFSLPNLIAGPGLVASDIYAADLDKDNDVDLIATTLTIGDDLLWYRNDGSGIFSLQSTIFSDSGNSTGVSVGDFNGDTNLDIILADPNRVSWFQNDGQTGITPPSFTENNIEMEEFSGLNTVLAEDLDGDGDSDVLGILFSDGDIVWYENTGLNSGVFANENYISPNFGSGIRDVFTANIDASNGIDIVAVSFNQILWYQNNGSGVFTEQTPIATIANGQSVYAEDLDGDGDNDIIAAGDNQLVWYENDGSGNFTERDVLPVSFARSLYAADLNGNGAIDLLSGSDDGADWYKNHPAVIENTPGAAILSFIVVDGNIGDTISFTVENVNNPSDNRFEVVNNILQLKTGEIVDYETESQITLTVTVTDSGDLSNSSTINVAVIDVNEAIPIILDLDNDGLEFTNLLSNEVLFDADADGQFENIAWIADPHDGILVYDADGDGIVRDINEISFAQYVDGAKTDLEGLRGFDSNNNNLFDSLDEHYELFKVWVDGNRNGISEVNEVTSLEQLGITGIGLQSDNQFSFDNSTTIYGYGKIYYENGKKGQFADVAFEYAEITEHHSQNNYTAWPSTLLLNDGELLLELDSTKGYEHSVNLNQDENFIDSQDEIVIPLAIESQVSMEKTTYSQISIAMDDNITNLGNIQTIDNIESVEMNNIVA